MASKLHEQSLKLDVGGFQATKGLLVGIYMVVLTHFLVNKASIINTVSKATWLDRHTVSTLVVNSINAKAS